MGFFQDTVPNLIENFSDLVLNSPAIALVIGVVVLVAFIYLSKIFFEVE